MDPSGEDMNSLYSPSFSSYFSTNLAQVVARVTTEFAAAADDDFSYNSVHNNTNTNESPEDAKTGYHNQVDDDFEFNLSNLAPAAGDIRPVYPVFDRDLLRDYDLVGEIESRPPDHEEESARDQIQLKNLFLDHRDGNPPSSSSSSSSSSEADDLDRIPPGSYCVWMPNKSPCASPGRCTKSNSTGSSATVAEKPKTWKLRDLLKRSKSDGKKQGPLMLLTPKKKVDTPAARGRICSVATAPATGKAMRETAALEGYLGGRAREFGDKNKRRSYLPYRQDLVGFFVSPRAVRKMHIPLSR